jgi:hypothetical protein
MLWLSEDLTIHHFQNAGRLPFERGTLEPKSFGMAIRYFVNRLRFYAMLSNRSVPFWTVILARKRR